MTNEEAERLARIESYMKHSEKEVLRTGLIAKEGLQALSDKLDAMDAKWDVRFSKLEDEQEQDIKDLAALKNKGAGILVALGTVFTITATVFADFFAHVKDVVFGG